MNVNKPLFSILGIDLAKKHPLPISPLADQSSKGIIFNSAYRNLCRGNMETYDFLQLTGDLVCSSQFTEYSWSNMEQYIKGTSESSMFSWQVGFTGPEITLSIGLPKDIGDVSVTLPPNTATAKTQAQCTKILKNAIQT